MAVLEIRHIPTNALETARLRLNRKITRDQYLYDLLELTASLAAKKINTDICSLFLLDDQKRILTLKAACRLGGEYLKMPPFGLEKGHEAIAIQEKRPIFVENCTADPCCAYPEIADIEHLHTQLCVPLGAGDEVLGVINFFSKKPLAVDGESISALAIIIYKIAAIIKDMAL